MRQQISSRNILTWLTVLILILACVPSSMVVHVPTLDPIAINTYIVQTANAAYTRTASVPTITPTFTPRSTLTPEATYTVVAPYLFPTGTKIPVTQYFRVKHDHQLEIYNHRSRTAAENWVYTNQTTEVVPLFIEPSDKSSTTRTNINGAWGNFMDALNDFESRKLRYLKKDDTALFDHTGFPFLESKTMGGNVITLDEISGGWGRVHTLDYNQYESPKEINYVTHPELVHKFVVVGWSETQDATFWLNPPPGDIYWPLVASRPVWIPIDRLEPFPTLPMEVVSGEIQPGYSKPAFDAPKSGFSIRVGEIVTIVDYRPSASDVWGRLSSGSWINLFTYKKGVPHYSTTWSMATLPPLPPVPETK